ncbi:hypothetical protein LCGC14_1888260 [marine sediment metagenome]|uniref:Uncharacterized protein n=1 Tax=marine sediment metagenome TaxID=412755 RepID=A0A0F9IYG6_9ZZZZ
MLYLVNWVDTEDGNKMLKKGAELVDAKSIYDAKSRFLRLHWHERRVPMMQAITLVKAKCLKDGRFAFPVSDKSFKDPGRAYEELLSAGVTL